MCEGITDNCVINLIFETERDRNLHREIFCNEQYTKCELENMLDKKYDD